MSHNDFEYKMSKTELITFSQLCIFAIFPLPSYQKTGSPRLLSPLSDQFPWISYPVYFGICSLLALWFYKTGPDKAITISRIDNYKKTLFI